MEFAVGNAAEWATVLIAVVAAFFAAKAWRASQAQANSTHEMLELERKREDRAEQMEGQRRAAEEQAAQADLVAAWYVQEANVRVAKAGGGVTYTAAIEFLNGSPLPVYRVEVNFIGGDGLARGRTTLAVLPPGSSSLTAPALALKEMMFLNDEGNPVKRLETAEDLSLMLHFTDVAGRRWTRLGDGRLIKSSG